MRTIQSENARPFQQAGQTPADAAAQCAEEVATLEADTREIDEAIAAGRKVLAGLIVQTKITDALSQAHQAKAVVFQVVSNLEELKRTAHREQSRRAGL